MSTNYYLVCDWHRVYLPFWRRTAGGTGPYSKDDQEREAVQDFLDDHLACPIDVASEHDDRIAGDQYADVAAVTDTET